MILSWQHLLIYGGCALAFCVLAVLAVFLFDVQDEPTDVDRVYYVHPPGKVRGRDGTDILTERLNHL